MSESINYNDIKSGSKPIVYVVQEIAGTKDGRPKINIIGASQYGSLKIFITRTCTNYFFTWSFNN
jgi:hypothetical protein